MVNDLNYRYFIEFSYDGSAYVGWQFQPNGISVQEEMEKCFSLKLNRPVFLLGCGRTDSGVHARFFVAHFDTDIPITDFENILAGLNRFLPAGIALKRIYLVPSDAHARFSAIHRAYQYDISFKKNPFNRNFAWYIPAKLDLFAMNEAAELLLNYDDFGSFARSKSDVKNHICKLDYAQFVVTATGLQFRISANRFLRNMVRAIVGTLVELGKGRIDIEEFKSIIEARNRSMAKTSAPAHGLFLSEVIYPEWVYQFIGNTTD